MAKATPPTSGTIRAASDDRWTCEISASPVHVHAGDDVTFTVKLIHPGIMNVFRTETDGSIDKIPGLREDQISDFYGLLNYNYDSGGFLPNIPPLNPATVFDQRAAKGSYRINVAVTAKDPAGVGDWFTSNQPSGALQGWMELRNALFDQLRRDGEITGPGTTLHVVGASAEPPFQVQLQRSFAGPTADRPLWPAIRNRTAAIGFDRYKAFIDSVFCEGDSKGEKAFTEAEQAIIATVRRHLHNGADQSESRLSIYGPYAYSVLKLATQVFLTLESGVVIRDINQPGRPEIFEIRDERIRVNDFSLTLHRLQEHLKTYLNPTDGNLPYLNRILENLITIDPRPHRFHEVLPYCQGVLKHRLTSPSLMELIWSYWHEEGMLVQTMNAIARRFQNRRGSSYDPLGELEFDPLRPLNNMIWGYIQDEHNRLTVSRRAHEYIHHYGLSLVGKAIPDLNPADTRSKFIEGFHNLLSAAARFFREDSDTTVIADAFPLLNALKDVHLICAEGAQNQFGDLTWTARAEMMTIQWMLARPEMREFLRGRYMVPYQEEWMGAVDGMKRLQGWTDTTITHFYELAVTGERILLSIRYGDWSNIQNIEDQAKNWARSCKPEIQRYIYAYQTVTGVDLSSESVDSRDAATRYLQPSMHLHRRLAEQTSTMRLRAPAARDLLTARTSARIEMASAGQPRLPSYRKGS
jgi:hypothetical protein